MYLVELRPGKEELYRTSDELAAAIRGGDVDKHSRIYHRATSKWISITLHPQYKAIVAAPPKTEPLPPLERSSWTFFNGQAEDIGVGTAGDDDQAASEAASEKPAEEESSAGNGWLRNWRRPLALSITGLLLILGVQLAFAGPRPPWSGRLGRVAPAEARPVAALSARAEESQYASLASTTASWGGTDRAVEPANPSDTEGATVLPEAPRLRLKALGEALSEVITPADGADEKSIDGLLQRYGAAYDAARARLETGMRVARLNQLFSSSRLAAGGGVTETRLSLAGLANFIRIYRQEETAIEQTYQDSFTVLSKGLKWAPRATRQWYGRQPRKEAAAVAALTGKLVADIDTLLGVLDAQAGTYTVKDGAIAFEEGAAARKYGVLRQRIGATVQAALATGLGNGGPMSQLLRAIGSTKLPKES